MKRPTKILVLDVGGTHVKCVSSKHRSPVKFKSSAKLTPDQMVEHVLKLTKNWNYQVVSIGYPGVAHHGKIVREPNNLGTGWVGFDFEKVFGCPVRIINDAAMQALGGYEGGKMLFLGLGTGLGSALIVDGVIVAMELGHLHYANGHTYEEYLGDEGRKRLGNKKWRAIVDKVVQGFQNALLPDYIMLGGGNVRHIKRLPPQIRRGDNAYAFVGGFRLWQQQEKHSTGPLSHGNTESDAGKRQRRKQK
ncbi:MAG TPA: ROK family protein [Gammaproteobacteria bacterium]|nr:ROK family protein [Gammaproteobacteria bacterium]